MHTIKFVALYTGLSQHTIRAWERRYSALTPARTNTNRRLYTTADLEKLSLLHRAVNSGHSIGQIASMTVKGLTDMLSIVSPTNAAYSPAISISPTTNKLIPMSEHAKPYLDECQRAVERLDVEGLEDTLSRGAALLGSAALIDSVMMPLMHRIGERWREGEARLAHEHMASAIVRTFLGRMLDSYQPAAHAPRLVVTTPAGQFHELGALVAAVTAASEGWRILYLGPNLPAAEIAGAVHQSGARALALSIVYPPDDPGMENEMSELRKYVGKDFPILAGGRAVSSYSAILHSIQAIPISNTQSLRSELEALRSR